MEKQKRYQGIVQHFDIFGGKGMILLPDGREVKVRYSAILGEGVRRLEKGAQVSFQLERTTRGLYAVRVMQE